jgi:hypothetical protein
VYLPTLGLKVRRLIRVHALKISRRSIIEETRQHISYSLFLDSFTREIVTKAFKSATQREELDRGFEARCELSLELWFE